VYLTISITYAHSLLLVAASGESTSDSTDHSTYRMVSRHKTLADLYEEWYGVGRYHDEYGGIKGRDATFGAKWRKHLNAQHYSRTKRVVEAIDTHSEKFDSVETAIGFLEDLYQTTCKQSVSLMVTACQEKGLLAKKKPRGGNKKQPVDEETLEQHEVPADNQQMPALPNHTTIHAL